MSYGLGVGTGVGTGLGTGAVDELGGDTRNGLGVCAVNEGDPRNAAICEVI